jgi:hypothetical protein
MEEDIEKIRAQMRKDWEKIEAAEIKRCKGTTFRQASDADHYLSKVTEQQEDDLMDRLNETMRKVAEERKRSK